MVLGRKGRMLSAGASLDQNPSRGDRCRRMVLRSLVLMGLAAAMVALVGCSSGGMEVTSDGGAVSTGDPSAVGAMNTITVQGKGTISSAPDEATITLAVENEGAEPGLVLDENSTSMKKVLERLKAEGVEESAIRTANVSVHPIRTYDPQTGRESLTGYRAQNSVTVKLRDAATIGKILAASVEMGATNVSGPVWRLTEDSAAIAEALKKAAANAQSKAQALAEAQGIKLDQILMIREGTVDVPVVPLYSDFGRGEALDSAAVAEAPINAGTLEVTAEVTVTYGFSR